MSLSDFEAAVYYDVSVARPSGIAYYVVFDTDNCSARIFSCLNGKLNNLSDEIIGGKTELEKCFRSNAKINSVLSEFPDEYAKNERTATQALENYYSNDKNQNYGLVSALSVNGTDISCSDIDVAFSDYYKSVFDVMKTAQNIIEEHSGNLYDFSLIMIGNYSSLYPVLYALRSAISVDPILPDSRIKNPSYSVTPAVMIEEGRKFFAENDVVGHAISVSIFDSQENRMKDITVVKSEMKKSELDSIGFWGPICIGKDRKLNLVVDGKKAFVEIPFQYSDDFLLVDVSAFEANGTVGLAIRKNLFPTMRTEILLNDFKSN